MIPDDKDNEAMSEEERAAAAEWEAMAGGDEASADGEAEQQAGGGGPKSNRVLDQDEIDSLLGLGGGGGGEDDKPSGIQAIINSALVSYERLPMLEIVFDRLVRMLSLAAQFTSDNVEVSLDSITAIRWRLLNSIPLPAMLGVFKAEEWDNFGLLMVDSSLTYSIVDVLLGGRRAPPRCASRAGPTPRSSATWSSA
jgi:flagellar motor switch protein FliM